MFAALGLGVTIVPRCACDDILASSAAGRSPATSCVVLGLTDLLAVHPVTVVFSSRCTPLQCRRGSSSTQLTAAAAGQEEAIISDT